MRAHKQNITVAADHEVTFRLPDDFPPGLAEIIVLAVPTPSEQPGSPTRVLTPHPILGNIVFHEDPSLPLDPKDWPEL
jgi:hypothetical protein